MFFSKIKLLISIALLVLLPFMVSAQDSAYKTHILDAIDRGCRAMEKSLLDEHGRAKGDYNMLTGEWVPYEPAWHTGQIIFALTCAFDLTNNEHYLDVARKSGDWWISLEIKDHPVLKGMVRTIHMDGINYIIFSTMSDGSAGLYRLYDLTGEKKYADIPTIAGIWMYKHMYEPGSRMFYDAVDPNTGAVMKSWSPFWEDKENQTLNDVARPNNEGSLFKDMYEYTGEEKWKKLFVDLCESLVEKQGAEGIWMDFTPNNKEEGHFHPRFNIWYAESLLEGYDLTGDRRYLEAALKVGRFYAKFQQNDGSFFYRNFLDGSADKYSISGSTTAFAGILWLRLHEFGVGQEFEENIQSAVTWCLDNQFPDQHPDRNLANNFLELKTRQKKTKVFLYNRDVGTPFCVRFLCDYYVYKW